MYEFFADSIGGELIMVGSGDRLFAVGWRFVEGVEVAGIIRLLLIGVHYKLRLYYK
jgi:hypothetical protein